MKRRATRKVCAVCGKEYETTAGNSKVCSPLCAYAFQRKKRKEWEKKNPDYYMKYYKNKIKQEKKDKED